MSHMNAANTPIPLAERVLAIGESASVAAAQRVRELKAAGIEMVNFTVGEPDFDTPSNIRDAAVAAIDAGLTRYTAVTGIPELATAIVSKAKLRTGVDYAPSEVTIGGGAKQVIFLALMATVEPGVEVLVPTPYWVSYPDMVRAHGGTPVIVDSSAEDSYLPTADDLERAITPATGWIILNTPGNPSGASYDEQALREIAALLDRHRHVHVLADDIYDEITFTEGPGTHLLRVAPHLKDRVLVVNGVSKTYAMTGWRIGYATGEANLIAAINKLQSQSSSCPSSISQAAAAEALTGDQSFVAEAVKTYRARRDLICELLNRIDGLEVTAPDGSFYAFVDCSGLIGRRTPDGIVLVDDQAVVLHLLDSAHVATIAGSAYGVADHFRISFATSIEQLRAGAQQIRRAVDQLSPASDTSPSSHDSSERRNQ